MVNACHAELIDEQNNELICWQFHSWSKLYEMGKISDAEYKKLMKDTEHKTHPADEQIASEDICNPNNDL